MDLARLSHLTGERLPQLIQLEREIDNEIIEEHNEADMMLYSPPPRVKPPLPPKPLGLSLVPKQVSEIACGPEETDVTPPTFERSSLGRLSESTEDDNDGVCVDEEPQELHSTCFDVPEPIESSEIGLGLRRQSSGLIVVPVADVAPCPQPAEVKVIFPTTTATSQCGVTQTMAIQCDLDEATNDIEQIDGVAEPASLEVSPSATLDISPDGRAQEAATPSPMPNTESAVTSTVKGVESVSTETGMMTIDMPESHEDTPAEMPSVPEAVAPAVKEETTVAEPVHKVQQVPMNVKFVKGDEIDEAVQIMSNQYGGRVKLKRVRKGKYEVRCAQPVFPNRFVFLTVIVVGGQFSAKSIRSNFAKSHHGSRRRRVGHTGALPTHTSTRSESSQPSSSWRSGSKWRPHSDRERSAITGGGCDNHVFQHFESVYARKQTRPHWPN